MFPDKNNTLGSGKLYFAPFITGTKAKAGPQEYFGNTPSLSMSTSIETLDHMDADNGIRTKDASVITSVDRTGSFATDHVSPKNLAKWFGGTASKVTQVAATAQTETLTLKHGGRYQLGESVQNPSGLRGLTLTSIATTAATPVPLVLNTDFTFDGETGGVTVLPGSTVVPDDDIGIEVLVTYGVSETTYNRVVSGNQTIEGELFFRADNGAGLNQDYLWPNVKISPDGDMELKGEDWQTLPFSIEVLKRDDATEAVYVNGRPGSGI